MTEKDEHPRPEEPRQFTQWPGRLDPPGPSQDLLERARVGWERFIGSIDD
ncbi:hypothetical protein [Streptomyces virginiae]|nr:hypothetical protein [Streptomyces sp. CMAA1738]MEC4569519.1 hypothetical protein [Streptomyces sp. CMAA1738]